MRILLLAPHPFYQARGTPIAVDLLLRTLAKRGDRVDVLTYPEGESRDYGKNVTIHRFRAPRFLRNLRPGFSWKKLLSDGFMYPHALRMAREGTYDCIHAIEESGFMARRIGRTLSIPYIFDMDSSMPRQIVDKRPLLRPLLPLMRRLEAGVVRQAAAVAPVCDAIARDAAQAGAVRIEPLRDISLLPDNVPPAPEKGFRERASLSGPVLLYIGNLEVYQGISLLLESFARLISAKVQATLVIVGGRSDDIQRYRAQAKTLGIAEHLHFTGPRPIEDMPHLFREADILVSPRTRGQNTPMKIYSYLDSGKPLLATRLPTHTQVLDDECALLTDPDPESMAAGFERLLHHPEWGRRLADNARRRVRSKYCLPVFEASVERLYQAIPEKNQDSEVQNSLPAR